MSEQTISLPCLKKRYTYYNNILKNKGSLTESQQKVFEHVKQQLGDNIPKTRRSPLTDEERKESRRNYYQAHKEQIKEYSKQWNQKNRDKVAEYNKRCYDKKKTKRINVDDVVTELVE